MLCLLPGITHSACHTVEMGVSARDLTCITLENNHTACMHVCLQGIGCVCVSKITRRKLCNHRHQRVQPSSVLKIKMVQPSSRTNFSFAIIASYGNQITPATHEDNLEMKVQNPYESQENRAVTSGTKRKHFAALSLPRPWWRWLQLQPSCGSPQWRWMSAISFWFQCGNSLGPSDAYMRQ